MLTRPVTVISAPGGGGTGVSSGEACTGGVMLDTGPGDVTGCAVGAPGDGSAGSVVTETAGAGAGVLDAARV